MIAFLRRYLHNRFVQPKIDAAVTDKLVDIRKQLRESSRRVNKWKDQYKRLNERFENLSERQASANRTAMVLSQETYETKVLRHIGNTMITQQDNEHSTAFKLGIQHALRHIEKECVAK